MFRFVRSLIKIATNILLVEDKAMILGLFSLFAATVMQVQRTSK